MKSINTQKTADIIKNLSEETGAPIKTICDALWSFQIITAAESENVRAHLAKKTK